MDVISEIVKLEKKAEAIVEEAKIKSEKIVSDAEKEAGNKSAKEIEQNNEKIEQIKQKYAALETSKCAEIDAQRNEEIDRLDSVLSENRNSWIYEAFDNIVS